MDDAGTITSVLFVCGRNSVRSPMARALAAHLFPDRFYVASAGVFPGERDSFVDAVLAEIGIAPGEHRPIALDELSDLSFDLAITLSPEAHHRTLDLTRTQAMLVEYWPTPDPTGAIGSREQIVAAYRDLRDRLTDNIRRRFGTGEAAVHSDGRIV